MPPIPSPDRCVACQGKKVDSRGRTCVPCLGTGKQGYAKVLDQKTRAAATPKHS